MNDYYQSFITTLLPQIFQHLNVFLIVYYLGCANDVLLIRRVLEIEERLAALETQGRHSK